MPIKKLTNSYPKKVSQNREAFKLFYIARSYEATGVGCATFTKSSDGTGTNIQHGASSFSKSR